jgi:hypothetical protein
MVMAFTAHDHLRQRFKRESIPLAGFPCPGPHVWRVGSKSAPSPRRPPTFSVYRNQK